MYEIIEKIANEHCHHTFGFLTKDDLYSEIWVICLRAYPEFDPEKGQKVEHFLRVTVKNRLINLFKDITKSVKSPCPRCPYHDPGESPSNCAKYGDDYNECDKWRKYINSVSRRNALLNPTEEPSERSQNDFTFNRLVCEETMDILMSELDDEFARDLQSLASGETISAVRLEKLQEQAKDILDEHDIHLDLYK